MVIERKNGPSSSSFRRRACLLLADPITDHTSHPRVGTYCCNEGTCSSKLLSVCIHVMMSHGNQQGEKQLRVAVTRLPATEVLLSGSIAGSFLSSKTMNK